MRYPITPVAKPRMTRSDKWKKRPCVVKYRNFCDMARAQFGHVELDRADITFHLPMPASWSRKKRAEMKGQPHRSRPDLDNLMKSIGDALYSEDSHIAEVTIRKVWAEQGAIEIT